jgi:hypothetical protein
VSADTVVLRRRTRARSLSPVAVACSSRGWLPRSRRSRCTGSMVRRRRGRRALIDRGVIAVAVDDLPLAVLAPVDMCDAKVVRLGRTAIDGARGMLIADRVGKVTTRACGHEFEAVVAANRKPRRDPPERPVQIRVSAPTFPARTERPFGPCASCVRGVDPRPDPFSEVGNAGAAVWGFVGSKSTKAGSRPSAPQADGQASGLDRYRPCPTSSGSWNHCTRSPT